MSRSRPRLRRCLFALSALPVLAAGLYAQSCPDPCSQYVNNDDPTKLTQCCRQYMVSPSCNGECPSDPPGCSQYAGESEPQQGYDLQRCCSPPGGAPNTGDSYCTQNPIYFVQYNSTKCASCAPPTQVFYHSASTPTHLPMGGWSRSNLLTICIDPAFQPVVLPVQSDFVGCRWRGLSFDGRGARRGLPARRPRRRCPNFLERAGLEQRVARARPQQQRPD